MRVHVGPLRGVALAHRAKGAAARPVQAPSTAHAPGRRPDDPRAARRNEGRRQGAVERTYAGALIDDAVQLRQAVMRLMALDCTEKQINFPDPLNCQTRNPLAPAVCICDVFR